MMTVATSDRTAPTLADLLHDLGDIAPARILLSPYPAGEEDVLDLEARRGRLCELVDGVLVEKPMGLPESFLAALLIRELSTHVMRHGLGIVTGEAGMMRLAPGLIRIPDVAFIRRAPGSGKLAGGTVPEVAPTLAVEVISASNTPREMERKVAEYFAAGTETVWLIDPAARTAEIYTSPTAPRRIGPDGALTGGSALPGYELPLGPLLAELEQHFER